MIALPLRVWDKKNKVMTYLPPLMPMAMRDGRLLGVLSTVSEQAIEESEVDTEVKANNFVVMYATGIPDATGKMVHDGDIAEAEVRVLEGMGMDSVIKRKGIVGWKAESMCFTVFLFKQEGDMPNATYSIGNLKILGNVWETPDLIGDGKKTGELEVIPVVAQDVAIIEEKKPIEGDCGVKDRDIICRQPFCRTCAEKPREARGDVSACCGAAVKTEWYADKALKGGGKHMHTCTMCGGACTTK